MASDKNDFHALQRFAEEVKTKFAAFALGEPESQLGAPFESLIQEFGKSRGLKIVTKAQSRLPGRLGKPDFAIVPSGLLAGFVELKAPGTGARAENFKGHDRKQWERFKRVPNIIYTDGNEWALYRSGKRERPVVRLSGDLSTEGKKAVTAKDALAVVGVLTDFLSWQPFIPINAKGKIDLKAFADMLAPLCRMLREDVTDALKNPQSPLRDVAEDWRQLLFPDADDDRFADAYAQTVTFALLLARGEGANPLSLYSAEQSLATEHALLSTALTVLTDPNAQAEISASLNLLIRVIGEVPTGDLSAPKDPWLYFYQDFLGAYDPDLRRDAGAYYTPPEVVRAQVRLIDDLLVNRLRKGLGFADPTVVTLDPAAGTGTYLLGVIEHALGKVDESQGTGAVPGQATALANNIYGFEIMVGPYAVAELRLSQALRNRGGTLPKQGLGLYLTDALESPYTPPVHYPYLMRSMAQQHQKALLLKRDKPVLVCLGNPPYDRHPAAGGTGEPRTGGWVRWGKDNKGEISILRDFLDPALAAGHGVHVKNLYNLYVYFWRWALWKVFEWEPIKEDERALRSQYQRPGIVSFITASSYLDGDAFAGMREHMRRLCDVVWILDLGGEGRGTRRSENVFAIQTPVAIAVAARYGKADRDRPAKVRYTRIDGTRDEKLKALDAIQDFTSLQWQDCPDDWQAPFRPAGTGTYFTWPLLTDLLPWQHSGVQLKRTWPIAPDKDTLERRWRALLAAKDKSLAFHGTGDREVDGTYRVALTPKTDFKPIASLPKNAPIPPVLRYAYRSFDRHCIIADGRLMSRPRPDLWAAQSESQVYLTSLFSYPLGMGPAVTACDSLPDLDHFRGSAGAKAAMPLYRDAHGKQANILPGLLDLLAKEYGRKVMPEDFLAYVYGILAQPAFTDTYAEELGNRKLHVPITKDSELFAQVRAVGAKLLWMHTYGERYVPKGQHKGQVPKGKARCTKPVPGDSANYPEKYEYNDAARTLHVGDGKFRPVAPDVYEFEVSGLKVVQSWLKYRMKKGSGKKSSPLDDIRPERWTREFTTELLELLWVLEATLAEYPHQEKLLQAVLKGDLFNARDFPPVPAAYRKPPKPTELLDHVEAENDS